MLGSTIGQINFEDKKFRGFHGYLCNLEIKYPCNFLHNRSGRFFVQHVHVVDKWLALWKYFKRPGEPPKSKLLYHRLYWQFSYFEQYFHAGPLIRRLSA